MPTVPAAGLRHLATSLLTAVGTPADLSRVVSDSLVNSNLAGHDSHGVLRLPGYLDAAQAGRVQVAARPHLAHTDRATARIDGAGGWGQPAMWLATETALDRARAHGLGCAVVNRSFHIGRVAPYVEHIARSGMVGIAMANAGPAVAPFGGRQRILGTNPFAWAVPRGANQAPLSFDIATAAVAEGKLRVAVAKGQPVAPGLLVTEDGRPTIAPDDFYAGGALLPFGSHKGYGLSLLVQVLGLGLAGLDTSEVSGPRGVNGPVIIVIDIAPFTEPERFTAVIEALCDRIVTSPPAAEAERVLLPGDQEIASQAEREANGIPIPDMTWRQITALTAEFEVEIPDVADPGSADNGVNARGP